MPSVTHKWLSVKIRLRVHHMRESTLLIAEFYLLLQLIKDWLRGPAVERRSLASVLSLSCARPVADA